MSGASLLHIMSELQYYTDKQKYITPCSNLWSDTHDWKPVKTRLAPNNAFLYHNQFQNKMLIIQLQNFVQNQPVSTVQKLVA
jgi:hypothetical protein